ncbi:MAG: DUF3078 domain-containing protein [Rubricoccaceae bacterium]|nr:DUF3078 domain-containing protein [Rubricoccaceae bacterium]
MDRFLSVLLISVLAAGSLCAQEEPDTLTAADGWRTSVITSLAGSQAAYSNWQEGGVDALAFTAALAGQFERVTGDFKQVHDLNLEYGQLRQDTLGFRKASDLIRYAFALQYRATGVFQPTFSLEARSQFAPGYDYDPMPEEYPTLMVVPGEELRVSQFAAPAYLKQVAGVTYDPDSWFTVRLGVGAKETIVSVEELRPLYGNDSDQAVRTEAGLDFGVEAQREVVENVTWQSRLGLFQAVGQLGDAAPDTIWENNVIMKVNDILNVNLAFVTLFDNDVSEDLQFKELLSVGFSFTVL